MENIIFVFWHGHWKFHIQFPHPPGHVEPMLINHGACLLMSTHSCLLYFFFSLLLQKIDEENEANLLAVLTETLDSLPVDEDGLPSFDALTDGDVTTDEASPSSMPDGTPPPQEAEEPSLVRTLPTV